MENNTQPQSGELNAEEKVELAMDKAIEAEQEEVKTSKAAFWITLVVAIIIVMAVVYFVTQ